MWFGHGVTILSGVTIGQGGAIGAESLECGNILLHANVA